MLIRPFHFLLPLFLWAGLAGATELETAQKLWMAGQHPQAMAALERALKLTPDDLKLRFARGVMIMEMGDTASALLIFTQLSQDFPDLPDPYNNLAVIRAGRGELDQARSDLEQALRLQPDHAQALENLGDVLLRQAARAYQRAQGAVNSPSDALQIKVRRTQALLQPSR